MSADNLEPLSEEAQLAIAHTPASARDALRIFLELDARIARIVAATSEPMLGQMRLAWWRETLGKPIDQRPQGDGVLDAIGKHWAGHEQALVALVDGWEEMLAEQLTSRIAKLFAEGRAAPFAALAAFTKKPTDIRLISSKGQRWALVDAALHVSEGDEQDTLLKLARETRADGSLPRSLRGLAVLDALARRSLDRGGRPMMEGRGAALVALRAAMLGR